MGTFEGTLDGKDCSLGIVVNAALRPQVVPGEADPATDTANEDGDSLAPSTRAHLSWAQ